MVLALVSVTWAALFFSSELSNAIWAKSAYLQKVQFPTRFFYVASITSVLALVLEFSRSRRLETSPVWRFLPLIPITIACCLTLAMEFQMYLYGEKPKLNSPRFSLRNFGATRVFHRDSGGRTGRDLSNRADSKTSAAERRVSCTELVRKSHERRLADCEFRQHPAWSFLSLPSQGGLYLQTGNKPKRLLTRLRA